MLGLFFIRRKRSEQELDIRVFKVVSRLLYFVLVVHIAVAERVGPLQVVDVVDTLQVHGQALKAVGNFAGDGFAIDAAHLLKISELRHLHAIEPNFPAQAPSAQGWIFPIVFDKTNVVLFKIKPQSFERAQIQIQNVGRRRLQHHLVLVVVLKAVGVLAIATIFRTAAGLHIGSLPWLWANGAQKSSGVRSACTHFHVIGLQQCAALSVPIGLQFQNDLLEGQHGLKMRTPPNSGGNP